MQYTTEALTNAKLLKLYSWESTFESKISDVYKEEMSYQTIKMVFKLMFNVLERFVQYLVPFLAISTYVYQGNEISMSQIVITSIMLNKAKRNFQRIVEFLIDATDLFAAMKRINAFLGTSEVQKNIIKQSKNDTEEIALSVKGSFSWGIDCRSTVKSEKESEGVTEEAGRTIDSLTTLKEIDL